MIPKLATAYNFKSGFDQRFAETAIAEAEGEVVLAEKRVKIAELHAQAAQYYKDPEAQKLRDRDIADELAKNSKLTVITGAGGIIDSIGELIGRRKS